MLDFRQLLPMCLKPQIGIFKREEEFIGRRVGIAGEHLTGDQMAAALSRFLGRHVHYQDIAF